MTKEEFRERLKKTERTDKEINRLIKAIDMEIKSGSKLSWEDFFDRLTAPALKGVVIRRYRINEKGHLVDEEVTL